MIFLKTGNGSTSFPTHWMLKGSCLAINILLSTGKLENCIFLYLCRWYRFIFVKKRKETLYSKGHQFHQYQQNKQWPLILNELTEHRNEHDIRCWKSMSWLGTGTKMWQSYACYWDPWILLITGSHINKYIHIYINIYKQMIKKNMHRFASTQKV